LENLGLCLYCCLYLSSVYNVNIGEDIVYRGRKEGRKGARKEGREEGANVGRMDLSRRI
jgi:hypothetical protein